MHLVGGNIYYFMQFIREYFVVIIYYYNVQWKRNYKWFDNNMQIKIKLFCVKHYNEQIECWNVPCATSNKTIYGLQHEWCKIILIIFVF